MDNPKNILEQIDKYNDYDEDLSNKIENALVEAYKFNSITDKKDLYNEKEVQKIKK